MSRIQVNDNGAGGQFSLTSGGVATNTVSVGAGISSVPVWYTNTTGGSYNLGASLQTLTSASASGFPTGTVTTGSAITVTVSALDASSKPMANQTLRVYINTLPTGHTSLIAGGGTTASAAGSYITITTDSTGHATFTYTPNGSAGTPASDVLEIKNGTSSFGTPVTLTSGTF